MVALFRMVPLSMCQRCSLDARERPLNESLSEEEEKEEEDEEEK